MSRSLKKVKYTEDEKQLALFAKALAHPVRVHILKLLNSQSCCYTGDLTELIPLAQSTISQHLKALNEAEILPPKVKYCLNQENWSVAKTLFKDLFDQ